MLTETPLRRVGTQICALPLLLGEGKQRGGAVGPERGALTFRPDSLWKSSHGECLRDGLSTPCLGFSHERLGARRTRPV